MRRPASFTPIAHETYTRPKCLLRRFVSIATHCLSNTNARLNGVRWIRSIEPLCMTFQDAGVVAPRGRTATAMPERGSAGFTSGAVTVEWTADPARGVAGDAAVDPDDIHVRLPVDWDSVDPIPPALAALMAEPGPVDVPLDDVVPGEPESAHSEVHA